MNIWGFYEQFPSVSVYFGEIDPSLVFGTTLCFIGDVTTEDTMGELTPALTPTLPLDLTLDLTLTIHPNIYPN